MDLTALTLAQIKKTLEDIKKMMKIVLATPLKTAGSKTLSAINYLENNQIRNAVKQFWDAKNDAQQALVYAKGQGNSIENLREVAKATQIIVLAKFCILSHDPKSDTIEPFFVLDDDKKRAIANELERDCKEFLEYHKSIKVGLLDFWHISAKNKEIESMKNTLLRQLYPYISEGKKYTNANEELPPGAEIECDSQLMPDGHENATKLILGFRETEKNEKNKIVESFYKDKDGFVVSVEKTTDIRFDIGFYHKLKDGIKIRPFKFFVLSPEVMGDMKFIRTTDQETIFYAKKLEFRRNKNVKVEIYPISLAFFLYKSAKNVWCCSPSVGEDDTFHSCSLRNTTVQDQEETSELPPLSGWEYFNQDGEWKLYTDELPIDSFATLDSLDCSRFIAKPWAALDRSKYKDEIIITASVENIVGACSLVCGVYKYGVHEAKEHNCKLIEAYKKSSKNDVLMYKTDVQNIRKVKVEHRQESFIYKTDAGKWSIDSVLGNSSPMYSNDSAPNSYWPPATGWKHYFGFKLPIELRIKIKDI